MSEEVEYDGDHFSTTEDAFEKFQSSAATTLEESDEYITLSDIVPPQPLIPNLDDELNEIPYDNEVILTSNIEDNNSSQHSEVGSQILDISGGNIDVQNYTENGCVSHSDGIPRDVEILNSNSVQRKVDVIHNRDYNEGHDMLDIGGQDFCYDDNQELIQDSVLSTTVGKHGSNDIQQVDDNNTNLRRTKRGRIPNTSKYPLLTHNDLNKVTTAKKRGRPKKVANDGQEEPDSTNSQVENSTCDNSNSNEISNTSTEKASKRGRHKKTQLPEDKTEPNSSTTFGNELNNTKQGSKKKSRPKKQRTDAILNMDSELNDKETNLVDNSKKNIQNNQGNKKAKGKSAKAKQLKEVESVKEAEDDEDGDDISLSQLKQMSTDTNNQVVTDAKDESITKDQTVSNEQTESEAKQIEPTEKRASKMPIMDDFEYNVDAAVKIADSLVNTETQDSLKESLLVEDTTKRSRRNAKKEFHYDEGSDEDPFANMESSEDETPRRRKKGTKYYSDDEYIPGGISRANEISSNSDSDINDLDDGDRRKIKRKKTNKRSENSTPRKRSRKSELDDIPDDIWTKEDLQLNGDINNDIEVSLEPAVIENPMKRPAEAWATSNEFENFIAQKIQGTNTKIKKVSSKKKAESTVTPIDIPFIDPIEAKKCVANSTQTINPKTSSTAVQTTVPYDIPMKTNKDLTKEQSEKACEFLNSVVKTTSELGQLMTQKSEDFIQKKINTDNVTDTFKMDYCVRKSFLLFKLAKHNLVQMEEDLAKQYDEFLKTQGLSSCREDIKEIAAKAKEDDDSDCEIVGEVPAASAAKPFKQENKKPTINPKTVFLNKELSIKIAKKPSVEKEKKIDIKTRHAVWINDSVMVKKVKSTQSFLAQDSRNKKPPDHYVTEKMVSDFFEKYYRQRAINVCAPFVSPEWTINQTTYACHYYVLKYNRLRSCNETSTTAMQTVNSDTTTNRISDMRGPKNLNPKSLLALCTDIIHVHLNLKNKNREVPNSFSSVTNLTKQNGKVLTLFQICFKSLIYSFPRLASKNDGETSEKSESDDEAISEQLAEPISEIFEEEEIINEPCTNAISATYEEKVISKTPLPLKTLCYERISDIFNALPGFTFKNDSERFKKLCELDDESKIQPLREALNETFEDGVISSSFEDTVISKTPLALKTLCYKRIADLFRHENIVDSDLSYLNDDEFRLELYPNSTAEVKIKSLFTFCVEKVQNTTKEYKSLRELQQLPQHSPESLKNITYRIVKHLLNSDHLEDCAVDSTLESPQATFSLDVYETDNFMINCVNTLSDEAFQKLEKPDSPDNYSDNDHDYEADTGIDASTEWVSQLQVQEFRSCYTPTDNLIESNIEPEVDEGVATQTLPAIVKLEPMDDFPENVIDVANVKTEPIHSLNEMTVIPESVVMKNEFMDNSDNRFALKPGYDVETFESFVRTNKMMVYSMTGSNDEIFSQSALRVRRQHEPDYEEDYDINMSLLVPHTYEPLQNAKEGLMESSSDESADTRKELGKKKTEKKKKQPKKAPKNNKTKDILAPAKEIPVPAKEILSPAKEIPAQTKKNPAPAKEIPALAKKIPAPAKEIPAPAKDKSKSNEVPSPSKEKSSNITELAILTRRMRERIRLEEKKINSSDSDSDVPLNNIRKEKKSKSKNDKVSKNDEIQCSNVDSTEKISENTLHEDEDDDFAGFSSVEQDEVTTFQNYMKKAFEKLVPDESNVSSESESHQKEGENKSTSVIDYGEPVELLECEPTMPIFDEEPSQVKKPRGLKRGPKPKESKNPQIETTEPSLYKERHGWHCYNIDSNDPKLYQNAKIYLEKLPESFVETYLEYQEITDKDQDDEEVDRLINLQSLNRAGPKDGKPKPRSKPRGEQTSDPRISRSPSPAGSDHYAELTPSEDEDANVEDEVPPPLPPRSSENVLAKNLLMNDQDSDSDGGTKKIKEEIQEVQPKPKLRPGPKSKTQVNSIPEKDLMLTADKMMNKELSLLHAPVVLTEEVKQEKEDEDKNCSNKEGKTRQRPSRNSSNRDYKNDDDSSSEEEKQWVNTKEKLLKRMGKKEYTSLDDAKRAKLVTEFIERRNDGRGGRRQGVRKLSKKKLLERQKQLRVLSKELFGESSIDATHTGKKGATQLFKGRRNIRAVIDKKSLARSTVLANMEEFERKRRLTIRQSKLRELLGCEEGVNVLVINNEVCLEYDFEEHQPIVTVHKFFTSVMKAHQYEGVKFMWDACFESIANVEAGHPGGGCILAHCMGLGKTLQVLALLHTVLTHPRVGMHRVLVCCPLSTVLNWVDEIHKWLGPVTDKIKVFELSKLRKTYERAYQLEDWYNGGGIFIIGYELFRSLTTLDPLIDDIRPSILKKIRTALLDPGPDIIVCDEGHLLKNDCSVLAVAMSRVVTKRRIVLTGTPMQNNLREYYCMVNFIKPNLLGTYSEYSNRFENPIMNGQHRDSREEDIKLMKARTHILHKVLEGCLQRQEASVLYPYLPKKHEYTVFISLTKCQWDLYKHYLTNYANYKNTKPNVLKDFHILQKIWSHPQVLHNFQTKTRDKPKVEKLEDDLALEDKEDIKPPETETWWLQYLNDGTMLDRLEASNKFVAVFKILHECVKLGDKVLIFSTSLSCLDALEFFLKRINDWNLGHDYYRLDGSVPAEVRQKWCREFNAEHNLKTKLFLISTRAGCLGLNMTAANRVIILDTSWNPAHDIQSIFRVYRFGQKKDCYIYRLVAMGTMEQKIYERSVTKQAVACRVVDEQQIDRHYNMSDLNELYRYDESGAGVAGGVAVGVCDVALLRVARDAALHAVHEHDSLLRGGAEPALPEHEREHAWRQFQQEHAHKQMQNDIDQRNEQMADRLAAEAAAQPAPSLAPPPPAPPAPAKRGRGRPPVHPREPAARARAPSPLPDDDMVRQITNILIQHDVTKFMSEPSEIASLVSRVRMLVSSGGALAVDTDDLTASIANVMLRDARLPPAAPLPPPPPLTDVQPPPPPPPLRSYVRRRPPDGEATPSTLAAENAKPPSPPPPLTDVQAPARPHPRRGPAESKVPAPPPPPPVDRHLPSHRKTRKRRAALVAENRFDETLSAVIDLDDDDEQEEDAADTRDDEWQQPDYYDDAYGEPIRRVTGVPSAPKPKPGPRSKTKPTRVYSKNSRTSTGVTGSPHIPPSPPSPAPLPSPVASPSPPSPDPDDSILLSDEETLVKVPVGRPAPPPAPVVLDDEEEVPLHPSLLGNQNFIKIVAHTYLAGNPMLDEDAAVLAAQYSIIKTIKESESSGKPIVSGPIYDIATKVLGKTVIKKVYDSNPKTKDLCAENTITSTLQTLLGTSSNAPVSVPAPTPAPSLAPAAPPVDAKQRSTVTPTNKRPMIGPKSKVQKRQLIEPKTEVITPQPPPVQMQTKIVPFKIVNNTIQLSSMPTDNSTDECILPDDEPRQQPPPPPTPPNPIKPKIQVFTNNPSPIKIAPKPNQRLYIPAGSLYQKPTAPVSDISNETICLDSDEEDATPMAPASSAPVPIALTGPNAQTLPLPYMAQAAQPLTAAPPRAKLTPVAFVSGGQAVPVSSAGPAVPQYRFSLASNMGPVPISLSGPNPHQIPVSVAQPAASGHPVPISLTGPNSQSMVYSTMPQDSASNPHLIPVSIVGSTSQVNSKPPVLISTARTGNNNILTLKLDGAANAAEPIIATTTPVTAPASNIILMPNSKKNLIKLSGPPPEAPRVSSVITQSQSSGKTTTVCKPGDIFRISSTGQVEVLHMATEERPQVVSQSTLQTTDKSSKNNNEAPQKSDAPKILNHVVDNIVSHQEKDNATSRTNEGGHLRTASSSSDSSRSPTPDPLDILKNVVVIQAPKPESKTRKTTSIPTATPNKNTSITSNKNLSSNVFNRTTTKETSSNKASPQNIMIKPKPSKTSTSMHNTNKTNTTPKYTAIAAKPSVPSIVKRTSSPNTSRNIPIPNKSTPNTSKNTQIPNKSTPSTSKSTPIISKTTSSTSKSTPIISKTTSSTSKSTPIISKSTPSTSKTMASTGKSNPNTSKSISITSIDLTDIGGSKMEIKQTKTSENRKLITIATPATSTSTKKSVDGKKGLSNTVDLTHLSESTSTKGTMKHRPSAKETTPTVKPKTEKRPAPVLDTAAAKKKKTELMTLKDFDIDDIDDIIELD